MSLRSAHILLGACACALATPASAVVVTLTFSGTTGLNTLRTDETSADPTATFDPATLNGTIRFDTDDLIDLGSGSDFDFSRDAALFTTNVTLSGPGQPSIGGDVFVSSLFRGAFGAGPLGYLDLADERVALDEQDAAGTRFDSNSFALGATSDVGSVVIDGVRLPDFAALTDVGFRWRSERRVTDASFATTEYRALLAEGVLDSLTVTVGTPGVVPEPATWAMLVLGFGLTGAAARRRATVLA